MDVQLAKLAAARCCCGVCWSRKKITIFGQSAVDLVDLAVRRASSRQACRMTPDISADDRKFFDRDGLVGFFFTGR
jgi:hypothetical protein